ncbi:DUF4097 family beta strand repeat-containing protein [Streptomyces sp. NPDC049555]|uniref:DUF4097 family beta strand repeat-containing protein n=1 Tax=unclassified Streptomyces TaxID=2593676 RepID=UPI0034229D1B
MPDRSPTKWSLDAPQKLVLEEPFSALNVRVVGGTVNIVGTDTGAPALELTHIEGPPLQVTHEGGVLTVAYDDLPWKNLLKWFDRKSWQRTVTVTLTVPTATRVEVGVVGANAVVSGVTGDTDVKGVTGDTTLVGVSGAVRAETVSGGLEAHSLRGPLSFKSVSGDLTLVESAGSEVRADSVSGNMTVDLAGAARNPSLSLVTVSGEIAVRLPQAAGARVEAGTTSGPVSCSFDDLRVTGQWGAKRISGTLGDGGGQLRVTTVSGAVALLSSPATAPEGKVL